MNIEQATMIAKTRFKVAVTALVVEERMIFATDEKEAAQMVLAGGGTHAGRHGPKPVRVDVAPAGVPMNNQRILERAEGELAGSFNELNKVGKEDE